MTTQEPTTLLLPPTRIQPLVRTSVRLLAGLLLVLTMMRFGQEWRATLPVPPVELSLRAYLPNNGGWVSEPLRVESGRTACAPDGEDGGRRTCAAHCPHGY